MNHCVIAFPCAEGKADSCEHLKADICSADLEPTQFRFGVAFVRFLSPIVFGTGFALPQLIDFVFVSSLEDLSIKSPVRVHIPGWLRARQPLLFALIRFACRTQST